MRKRLSYIICIPVLFCCFQAAWAQNGVILKATTDRNAIMIGEPVKLNLELNLPLGYEVQWPAPDSLPHFVILEKGKIDSVTSPDGKSFHQEIIVTSFDSGSYYIPSLPFYVANSTYLSDSVRVDIHFSDFDPSKDYHELKDIIELQNPYAKYIAWGVSLFTLTALVLLIWVLNRKKTIVEEQKPVYISKLGPHEEAMAALDALQKQRLPENGQVKLYYTQLNDIIRLFVWRKLGISSMEKTNEELILQLKMLNMRPEHFSKLAGALRMGDFVKFAKYQPDSADNETNFETIRSSIGYLNEIDK